MKLELEHICKSYQGLPVIQDLSLTLEDGQIYGLMGPSGAGKTTLLRMLMGLEQPDSGTIKGLQGRKLAAVFQEDRLCEAFSPVENVMLATGRSLSSTQVQAELENLLPREALSRPVSTFSGGMKRRTAIVRALLAPWDILLMDEPFTGLDEETKKSVIAYILEKTAGRLVIMSTHQEQDLELLHASLIAIPQAVTSSPPAL